MRIIICGAGKVGSAIAMQLSRERHDVVLIDVDENLLAKITDSLDVKTVTGFASHPSILEEAGAKEADMLIALTQSDEVNMIACQVAHSLFGVTSKIARLRTHDYLDPVWKDLYRNEHMPIDEVISPEQEVANSIVRVLKEPGALDIIPFLDGEVMVIAINIDKDSIIANLPLSLVKGKFEGIDFSILGFVEGENFIIPEEKTVIHPGSKVYFAVASTDFSKVMELLYSGKDEEIRRVMIIGGGNIGLSVARGLEAINGDYKTKIIETDKARAEKIEGMLEESLVIHGDGINREILMEAGVGVSDMIIGVTNNDEVNILGCLLAKRNGCKHAITLVNNQSYIPMLRSLGIDVVINPRENTISSILQYIRKGKIERVHSIMGGDLEIVEATVVATSEVIGKKISDIEEKGKLRVVMVRRDDEVHLPGSDMKIQEDDTMLLISIVGMNKKLEKLFSASFEY